MEKLYYFRKNKKLRAARLTSHSHDEKQKLHCGNQECVIYFYTKQKNWARSVRGATCNGFKKIYSRVSQLQMRQNKNVNFSLILDLNNSKGHFTSSSSLGRSPPLLMPRFIDMNWSTLGLSLTLGLWRLVLSMIMAKLST